MKKIGMIYYIAGTLHHIYHRRTIRIVFYWNKILTYLSLEKTKDLNSISMNVR
jgi:hypothetical protein